MLKLKALLYCLVFSTAFSYKVAQHSGADYQPQQTHISFGKTANEIVITWVTPKSTGNSIVNYGPSVFLQKEIGAESIFVDGGPESRYIWNHKVYLKNLTPDTQYVYNCGSSRGWSDKFSFRTVKNGTNWPVRIAMYGDLGVENPQSLSRLQMETEEGSYDAILHVGDFAYDMDTNNSIVGDMFMQVIEPIAAYVPYMVCPGNHEQKYNFSNYRARFSMPYHEETENLFYSWNLGTIHFVSINTEAYYFLQYGLKLLSRQYIWLQKDLKQANTKENRSVRPWIILYGHRPMYCSTTDRDDCSHKHCITRVGFPFLKWYGMEHLLMKYGVDLAVWAHEHVYERAWPLYDYTILNGSMADPYRNPRGPVHIITGSAGCKERHEGFSPHKPFWSAKRSNDYGYTRLTASNTTHLHIQQVSDDKNGDIVDDVWIVQEKHAAFQFP